MSTLSRSIQIAASPTTLWNQLTTVAEIAEWYDDWDIVEYDPSDDRVSLGSTFRLVRHRAGMNETAWCRITVFDAPQRLGWMEYAQKLPAMSVEFHLVPEGPDGTLLTHTKAVVAGPVRMSRRARGPETIAEPPRHRRKPH